MARGRRGTVRGAARPRGGGSLRAEESPTVAEADAETRRTVHLLRRATFAPRLEDMEEAKRLGREAWLERQLHPEGIPDRDVEERLASFDTLNLEPTEYWAMLEARRPPPCVPGRGEDRLEAARARQREINRLRNLARREVPVLRAVYSRRLLQEVMLEFWRNHFNVDVNKDHVRYYLPDWERDVLRAQVFSRFEDLLLATAHHPAMLFCLDNHVSQAPMARGEKVLSGRGREERNDGLTENYARELMELHTVGVDNGYDQDDVIQTALVLTGWSIENRGDNRGAFVFRERSHARGRKKVMRKTVKAQGLEEGEAILAYLAQHPNTREFVCAKLVRPLAADEPPASLVAAVTAFFEDVKTMRSQVTLVIMTEFGRTNAENGNRGTDHGHGSAMFVVGGQVKGGKVFGDWTTLAPGRTYQNRDLEVTTDFRTALNEVLHSHLKLHPSKRLFPGFADEKKLGLFG